MKKASFLSSYFSTRSDSRHIFAGVMVLIVLLASIAAWSVYSYFANKHAQEAHKVFVEALAEFDKNLAAAPDKQKWGEVVKVFDEAHKRVGSSKAHGIGIALEAYRAQALVYDKNLDEAIKAMSWVVVKSEGYPLYYNYRIKYYLMKLDSPDNKVQEEAIAGLESLVHDAKNTQLDRTLYALGDAVLARGDSSKARANWTRLIGLFPDSPYTIQAKEKLAALKT